MKDLKVKSILFSLLAIMTVAVFMTSCERESIVEDDVEGWKTSPLDNDDDDSSELDNDETTINLRGGRDHGLMSDRGRPNYDCNCIYLSMSPANLLANGIITTGQISHMPPGWGDSDYWIDFNVSEATGLPNTHMIKELLIFLDTNGDGEVTYDEIDVLSLLVLPYYADLNGDGFLTSNDNLVLPNYVRLLGLISGADEFSFNQDDIDCITKWCIHTLTHG